MVNHRRVTRATVVSEEMPRASQITQHLALYKSDGTPINLEALGQGSNILVQHTEPVDVPVNSLWVEIDTADPPNVVAIHVAVA